MCSIEKFMLTVVFYWSHREIFIVQSMPKLLQHSLDLVLKNL